MNTKPTRLLILNQYASTPKYSSGAGERYYYLAPHFKKANIDVTLISGAYNHLLIEYPKTPDLFNKEEVDGGNFYWVKLRAYRKGSFLGRLLSWFEFLFKLFRFRFDGKKPDVVLVSSMSIFPSFYALYLKWRYKTKFILEIRDIWPLTPMLLGGYSKNHPFIIFLKFVEKFAYKRADAMISVLPNFNDHLQNVLGKKCKSTWIPNAIQEVTEPESVHQKANSETFKVIYTGAIGLANAMETVIHAARILQNNPEVEFILIGEGPDKEKLRLMAEDWKLTNVIFRDKILKDHVHQELRKADLAIISWTNSKLYDFGVSANKYNDYMMAEVPILSASNIKSDPVVMANCGLQVPAENPEEFAAAILKLKDMSSEERHQLGKNGRNYLIENNTYSQIQSKFLQVFDSLLSEKV
ncbi:MAG: glycosyltransferase [Bacteroidetes bacterium]|nr:glycosyltransferase [Bacteroidota bacterium]